MLYNKTEHILKHKESKTNSNVRKHFRIGLLKYISVKNVLLLLTGSKIQTQVQKISSLTSKGSVTASDDDGSDVAVIFKVIQGLSHLLHQPVTQSVQSLRPVQLDETHIILLTSLFHQNILILTT